MPQPLNWPLRFRFVEQVPDAIGTGLLIRVLVVDALGAQRKDVVVNVNKDASLSEILTIVREQLDQVAGPRDFLIGELVKAGTMFDA